MKKPLLLCILDGFGWVPDQTYGNAILAARTPNLDKLFAQYPYTTIGASGMNVGLPDGQMGNSEVGHTNIGAGRALLPGGAGRLLCDNGVSTATTSICMRCWSWQGAAA